jgi:hypothetical protein
LPFVLALFLPLQLRRIDGRRKSGGVVVAVAVAAAAAAATATTSMLY